MNATKKILGSQWARPVILVFVILAIWDLVIRIFKIPPFLVPTPVAIIEQIAAQWPMLLRQSLPTLYATLGGFGLSVLVGVPVAVMVASSRLLESYLYPLVVFSQSIPKVAIAPLFVVWFGFGLFPRVLVAFLLGFFPVIVSTVMGFKSIEKDLVDLARSMGSTPLRTFFKISLPHALPSIFASMKVSITLAVVGAVVGEFVGANSGLGFVLQRANGNFDQPLIFSALVVLSVIGALLFMIIDLLERVAIPWHSSHRSRMLGQS